MLLNCWREKSLTTRVARKQPGAAGSHLTTKQRTCHEIKTLLRKAKGRGEVSLVFIILFEFLDPAISEAVGFSAT